MNPEQWLSLKWNGGSTMSDRWLNQSKIIHIVNPMIIEEEQPLLNDVLQNYKFFISYNDFSETTKECFKDLKNYIVLTMQIF